MTITKSEEWNQRLNIFFDDWVDKDGKITMKVIKNTGESIEYPFFKIEELVNPKYSTFELIKKIIKSYNDAYNSPALAGQESNHYNNLLLCLACVEDCCDESDLMIWEQRFKSKFN